MSDNPFQAPLSTGKIVDHTPIGSPGNSKYHYLPLGTFSLIITILIGMMCFSYVTLSAMETIGNMLYPSFSDPNAWAESDGEMALIYIMTGVGLLSLPVYLGAGIFVCMFCYRSNANLRSFGATHLKTTPGWCAGWWFVPIMSLFKPYQAVKEIFQCSQRPVGRDWMSLTASSMLPLWWTCWIVGSILGQIEGRLAFSGTDLGTGGLVLTWVSTAVLTGAGFLMIMITRRITEMQTDWVEKRRKA